MNLSDIVACLFIESLSQAKDAPDEEDLTDKLLHERCHLELEMHETFGSRVSREDHKEWTPYET